MFINISTKELQEELKRRQEFDKIKPKPKLIDLPDIKPLQAICQQYIESLGKDDEDDDDEHYIFEVAMETFFGEDVWIYIDNILGG